MLKPIQKKEDLQKELFDIIFVGGGPSTLSYILSLFQNNSYKSIFLNNKILILEKSESFGAGCLGNYGMRTNTTADGFLKLIFTKKIKKEKKEVFSTSKLHKQSSIHNNKFNLPQSKKSSNSLIPINKKIIIAR